ncbi:MAG: efflux RND transporter periplasmic adaptor subunit, partial [Sedimenticolaceae bacterium]
MVFLPVRTAPATAVSLNDAQVSAEIGGVLMALPVKVGDRVKEGDVVAQVDCREPEIALVEARASLQAGLAKNRFDISQLNKAKQLSKSKSISADEIDRRTSNAAVSEAEVDRLKAVIAKMEISVGRCRIASPFDAVVTERLASVGDYMDRGRPVVRLLYIGNIEVKANIQEKDLASLNAAREFEFATREESYRVSVRTVLPQMDSRLRSFEARLSFVERPAVSGSVGRLSWRSPVAHLPADTVVDRNGLGVFVLDDGKARFLPLPDAIAGMPAAVEADPATRIVIDGRYNLQDGDSVVVNE